jgi:hypothetical protein
VVVDGEFFHCLGADGAEIILGVDKVGAVGTAGEFAAGFAVADALRLVSYGESNMRVLMRVANGHCCLAG